MGVRAASRALKPQPDGKREQSKKKRTLKEVASEMKEEMRSQAFEERRRHEDELRSSDEKELLLMIFGPDRAQNDDDV